MVTVQVSIKDEVIRNLQSDGLFLNGLNYMATHMDKATADEATAFIREWNDAVEDFHKGQITVVTLKTIRRNIQFDALEMVESPNPIKSQNQ